MRTNIKFCGFQTVTDVQKVIPLDLDAIGFILVPGRKRTVSVTELPKMVNQVPEDIRTVGVLMNPSIEELTEWLQTVPLSTIQLHGDEPPEFCRAVRAQFPDIQLIKTFHIEQETTLDQLKPYLPYIDIGLLDSIDAGQKGGTGKTFDWSRIPSFTAWARTAELPLWIAGGITPHNVQELMHTYQPDGVDISSGIERNGKKDLAQMRQLIEKVR